MTLLTYTRKMKSTWVSIWNIHELNSTKHDIKRQRWSNLKFVNKVHNKHLSISRKNTYQNARNNNYLRIIPTVMQDSVIVACTTFPVNEDRRHNIEECVLISYRDGYRETFSFCTFELAEQQRSRVIHQMSKGPFKIKKSQKSAPKVSRIIWMAPQLEIHFCRY